MSDQDRKRVRTRGRLGAQTRMFDVAELAGVSPQTVSRALSRPELVTEATRRLVQDAVAKLNYIPDGAARNLASRSSRVVAVIIPMISSSIYAVQVNRIIQVLEARGLSVVIGNSEYSPEREEKLVGSFMERRPDGLILTGRQHTEGTLRMLAQGGVPVVETWDNDGAPLDMAVGFSNFEAGAAVGRLFLARGIRRAGFVSGEFVQDFRAQRRHDGFADALAKGGSSVTAQASLQMPLQQGDGVRGLDAVLTRDPLVEGIFFSADSLALAALLECNRRGVRMPEQLAICGFGDYDLSASVTPGLTTVRIPTGRIGEAAAELILARLDDSRERPDPIVNVGFELQRRGSA